MITAECLACSADGVDGVGLRAVTPRWSAGPIEFDDPLATLGQEQGDPGAVSVGILDRPGSQPGVAISSGEKCCVAGWVLQAAVVSITAAVTASMIAAVSGVFVSVDADDVVDEFCQRGHRVCPLNVERDVPVGVGDRQDCDGVGGAAVADSGWRPPRTVRGHGEAEP